MTDSLRQKAFDYAVECLRTYIERGDSYEYTAHGLMGCHSNGNWMTVGGYVGKKKLSCHQVGVSQLEGQEVEFVFSLKEIFDYVLEPSNSQLKLF
jgi:hypothetical protein